MAVEPQQPIVLSDEEDEEEKVQNTLSSNPPSQPFHHSKKRRLDPYPNLNPPPTVLVLDDDDDNWTPPPLKPTGPTSSRFFVLDDTPPFSKPPSLSQPRVSYSQRNFSGISGLVCLESDNESEDGGSGRGKGKENETIDSVLKDLDWSSRYVESTSSLGRDDLAHLSEDSSSQHTSFPDDIGIDQVLDYPDKENRMDQLGNIVKQRRKTKVNTEKNIIDEPLARQKMTKEEKKRLMEGKKLKKQQEKLQRPAQKAEAAEKKKIQKNWEKGKLALESIVAEIDSKVVELGSVGGSLLTKFSERGLTYRITSNPIERSIVWTMTVPEHISQSSPGRIEIQYILLVYDAEEFCKLVISESLLENVSSVRSRYPSYTVCYLTNRLMSYINKREQEVYKNPTNNNGWIRPPVEEVLAKLTTNFIKVHSRQCIDEAELAEHIVGLTCNLASCQFRKKLTRLDVNANGTVMIKDRVDRNIINKRSW